MARSEALVNNQEMVRAWRLTIILAVIGGFLFLRPFLSVIALAGLMAFLFNPFYKWMLRRFKRTGVAATLTTLFLFFVVGIPIVIVMSVAVYQAVQLANNLDLGQITFTSEGTAPILKTSVDKVNEIAKDTIGTEQVISEDQVKNFLQQTLPDALKSIADLVVGIVSSFPAFFTSLILFIFVFVGFLVNQNKFFETVRLLSPFDDKVNDVYFKRMGAMATAMVKGQFIIAAAQGLVSSLAMLILGLGEFFIFFLLIFTFLSLIPLGAGIIVIPVGILAIIFGDIWQGLAILAIHFLVTTNIDNFRPRLVPKEARLPAALTILAAFAGVVYFGLPGVIYGPIIMIFLVTTIETYTGMRKAELDKKAKAA